MGNKKTTNWSPVQFSESAKTFDVNIIFCRRPAPRRDLAVVQHDDRVTRPGESFRPALSVD